MIGHKGVRSKMKKTEALLEHPIIAQHVPETVWFDSLNLMEMLARHRVVYLKPNTGFQGNKVIRVKKVNESDCVLSYNNASKNIPLPGLSPELETIMAKRKYIIQQGIDLATYKDCPFDIRMVMQKPYTTWELTLTSVKVAPREDAVVTNVARGAQEYQLNDILQIYDQRRDPLVALRELVDLAHQIANILGARFPFRIIGLDMAIDKQGRPWFIEANTKPRCTGLNPVNDQISQQKYKAAKNIITRNKNKPHFSGTDARQLDSPS